MLVQHLFGFFLGFFGLLSEKKCILQYSYEMKWTVGSAMTLSKTDHQSHPTNLFTILEHQNQSRDVSELHKMSRSPDLEALKLWNGLSGINILLV